MDADNRVRRVEEGGLELAFCAEDMSLCVSAVGHTPASLAHGPKSVKALADIQAVGDQTTNGSFCLDDRPRLDRLTLAVANLCNLACSYCYAVGGTYYNTAGALMAPQTAMNALNRAAATYSRIDHINFFGGEPTLNLDIVEMAYEYVQFLHSKGLLAHIPTFGITTNGYALSERAVAVLKRHGFSVTLSLDGPKEIHDKNRRTKNGTGTFDSVARSARLLSELGLDVEFECTYTADHHRQGISIVDLLDFFHREFECKTLHCQIAAARPDSPEYLSYETCLTLMGNAVEYSLVNCALGVRNAVSVAVRLLSAVTYRTPIGNYCPAGRSELTVNADGELYACFMLMQSRAYSFGSVNESRPSSPGSHRRFSVIQPQAGSERGRIENLIEASDKSTNAACRRCWAQPLCFGCQGEDMERLGTKFLRSDAPGVSAFCDYKRGLADRFLRSIVRAHLVSEAQAGT